MVTHRYYKGADSAWAGSSRVQPCLCRTSVLTHCKSLFGNVIHDHNILWPLPSEMLSRHSPPVILRKCCNSGIYHCGVLEENWMCVCALVCLIFVFRHVICLWLLTQLHLYILIEYIYTVIIYKWANLIQPCQRGWQDFFTNCSCKLM